MHGLFLNLINGIGLRILGYTLHAYTHAGAHHLGWWMCWFDRHANAIHASQHALVPCRAV